jgi:ParB family transcriptional regulator, chromosome partitioning protein
LGHAKALLAAGDERAILQLAREIVANGMSVRDVEERTRAGKPTRHKGAVKAPEKRQDPEAKRLEDQLRRYLQTDVTLLLSGRDRGEIRIAFYSNDDLERVMELLLGATGEAL